MMLRTIKKTKRVLQSFAPAPKNQTESFWIYKILFLTFSIRVYEKYYEKLPQMAILRRILPCFAIECTNQVTHAWDDYFLQK